ncbi:hypothetical protein FRX31_006474 [Thalictrum thalictroides]|uniref:DUF4283 domain-containing protein n=1 Tax=Thalictrum thalictroides TaxID=46969 RepID=A0A7J6X2G5_THATH|nr:hypothetical protein FRX31_006474 [Thalictrum thalictroides]
MEIPENMLKDCHAMWAGSLIATLLNGETIDASHAMDPFAVRFDTIPLWMNFKGLHLEHYTPGIVRFIGMAAGEVVTVLLEVLVPRSEEGYRARVKVKVFEPLKKGTPAKTLHQGSVLVGFSYHLPPNVYCETCNRLGYEQGNCTFPPLEPTVDHDNIFFLDYSVENLFINDDVEQVNAASQASMVELPLALTNSPDDDCMADHEFETTGNLKVVDWIIGKEVIVGPYGTLQEMANLEKATGPSKNGYPYSENLLVSHIWTKLGLNTNGTESSSNKAHMTDIGTQTSPTCAANLGSHLDLGVNESFHEFPGFPDIYNQPLPISVNYQPEQVSRRPQIGISITEPDSPSATRRIERSPSPSSKNKETALEKGKGKIKVPYQMEEDVVRPLKKRKSDNQGTQFQNYFVQETGDTNHATIAGMWEIITSPMMINYLAARGFFVVNANGLYGENIMNINNNEGADIIRAAAAHITDLGEWEERNGLMLLPTTIDIDT